MDFILADFIVTCETLNCENQNLEIQVKALAEEPNVICGACSTKIIQVVPVTDK